MRLTYCHSYKPLGVKRQEGTDQSVQDDEAMKRTSVAQIGMGRGCIAHTACTNDERIQLRTLTHQLTFERALHPDCKTGPWEIRLQERRADTALDTTSSG
jgi:hypothetical protein